MKEDPVQSGSVVAAVVVDPSPNDGVIHSGQIRYRSVTSPISLPIPNRFLYRFGCFIADGRTKVDKEFTPSAFGQPRTKRKPQEVKLLIGVTATAVVILAVNNLCLFRMQLQIALPQSLSNTCLQVLRFRLGLAVHKDIISVALKWDSRVVSPHPVVKGIV